MKILKTILLSILTLLTVTVNAQNKEWMCIDENGEELFTVEAKRVYPFQNGLARIYKKALVNNQWVNGYGFINTKGEFVIPCNFDKAKDFYGPVTWVRAHGEKYYDLIDQQGNVVPTRFKYEKVGNFYEWQNDISAVYKDQKMGFVNISGEEVIPCEFYGSNSFSDGLACVARHGEDLYGYINKKGEEVIPLEIEQTGIATFKNGKARAYKNGRTVIIDKKGDVVFKTDKGNIQSLSDDMIMVYTEENRRGWGWLNYDNEFVIEPQYDHASNFNESGYALVEKDGLYGLIDRTGKQILDFKYKNIFANVDEDGFISAVYPSDDFKPLLEHEIDYFDENINPINFPDHIKYVYPAEGEERIKFLSIDDKVGYMDRDYNIVIKAQYDKGKPFSEGKAFVRNK